MMQSLQLPNCSVPASFTPQITSTAVVLTGTFETGDFPGWTVSCNPIPAKVDTLSRHSVLCADLTALSPPSFVEQFLATTRGVTYDLTYFLDLSTASTIVPIGFLTQATGIALFDPANTPPLLYRRDLLPFIAVNNFLTATVEPSSEWLGSWQVLTQ